MKAFDLFLKWVTEKQTKDEIKIMDLASREKQSPNMALAFLGGYNAAAKEARALSSPRPDCNPDCNVANDVATRPPVGSMHCPACYGVWPGRPRTCPACGYDFGATPEGGEVGPEVRVIEGQLVKAGVDDADDLAALYGKAMKEGPEARARLMAKKGMELLRSRSAMPDESPSAWAWRARGGKT